VVLICRLTEPDTQGKMGKIALALRLAGPLLSLESEYTFDEIIHELETNPTKTWSRKNDGNSV